MRRNFLAMLLFLLGSIGSLAFNAAIAVGTPLDDYIRKPDPTFTWRVAQTVSKLEYDAFVIELQSQTWREPHEVDRTLWQHWLTIVRPKLVTTDRATVIVGGGRNGRPAPPEPGGPLVTAALASLSVVAELRTVPNQPLIFLGDGVPRTEDDAVAMSWKLAMDTRDPEWNIRFPMVKSVVRAMDVIDEFMASRQGGGERIKGYVIVGGSKRGWTTWLTGAVDRRVVAIAPLVIDVLNVRANMKHHFESYGFWSPAHKDYINHGFNARLFTPEFDWLMAFEDPFNYRNRLRMPKYVVNASGDEFFMPDGTRHYFNALSGPKYLRIVPNTGHSLAGMDGGQDAAQSIAAFASSMMRGLPLPQMSWTKAADGTITVRTNATPVEALLWQATNPSARDFRFAVHGPIFTSTPLAPSANGTYVARLAPPPQGFTAFFIELTFPTPGTFPLKLTSEVSIVPDILPFKGQTPGDPEGQRPAAQSDLH